MSIIQFFAQGVTVDVFDSKQVHVTLDANMTDVVEDMSVSDRLHEIEPIDIVESAGAVKLLNAMGEIHFDEWVQAHGDYYEALNAIGIEKIQEWLDTYVSCE